MATFATGPSTIWFNNTNLSSGWLSVAGARAMEDLDVDPDRDRPVLGDPLSSCPFKPGTDEWKQWQQDYIAINPSTTTSAPADFDRDVDERDLGRMLAASRLPVDRVAYLNQQMREAREAIDLCGPARRLPASPHGIYFDFKIDMSGLTSAVQQLSRSLQQMTSLFDPWHITIAPRVRASRNTGRKRRHRPPAPAARDCRHGNPSNHCRDCSMGRR